MPTVTFVTDIEGESSDLTTGNLVDLTHYSSPARNTLALFVYLYKRDASNVDTAIVIDNSLPLTATQWNFLLASVDGGYVAKVFGFNIWSAGAYVLNDCVYYNGAYYIENNPATTMGVPGISPDWTVITDILGTCTGNSTVQQTTTYNFSVARASSGSIGDALADLGPRIKDGRCKNWEDAAGVLIGAGLIESAWTNFRRADYTEAQSIMDYVDAQNTFIQ